MPNALKCPVCRADYRAKSTLYCRRCGVDLAPLIQLHDQAIWHYQQAIAAFEADDISTAQQQIERAIALHSRNATFHTFAGQLWALQGKFDHAIAAWKTAIDIHPDCSAQQALQILVTASRSEN
ncbi:tetratricopeptide repeat protein [Leptolyngbya sp. AN03gr2]|uniref:tetratricopeptide repeat protein n=1 Tax=unclassified Leptolyngbya TaxID=2650499 RepID=UPI003D31081C